MARNSIFLALHLFRSFPPGSHPAGPRVGRPKALSSWATEPEKHTLELMKAIAKHSSSKSTRNSLAQRLSTQPPYNRLSQRTLRRYVTEATDTFINLFKAMPPDQWKHHFKIEPPASMTEDELFKKATEFIRLEIELLAKEIELLANKR